MPKKLKPMKKCEGCGKMFKHLKKYKGRCKKWEGKKLCSNCCRSIPRNPYFVEVKDRPSSKITRFSLSQPEKKMLHSNYECEWESPCF